MCGTLLRQRVWLANRLRQTEDTAAPMFPVPVEAYRIHSLLQKGHPVHNILRYSVPVAAVIPPYAVLLLLRPFGHTPCVAEPQKAALHFFWHTIYYTTKTRHMLDLLQIFHVLFSEILFFARIRRAFKFHVGIRHGSDN